MNRDDLTKELDNERYLFGMFFAFGNRLQSAGDKFYEEITCKQFFLMICLSLFQEEAPTINQLSDVMGSSHQNVKQIVNKLEEKGYVKVVSDINDKRKIRVELTDKRNELVSENEKREKNFMNHLYKGTNQKDIETTLKVIKTMENNLLEMENI